MHDTDSRGGEVTRFSVIANSSTACTLAFFISTVRIHAAGCICSFLATKQMTSSLPFMQWVGWEINRFRKDRCSPAASWSCMSNPDSSAWVTAGLSNVMSEAWTVQSRYQSLYESVIRLLLHVMRAQLSTLKEKTPVSGSLSRVAVTSKWTSLRPLSLLKETPWRCHPGPNEWSSPSASISSFHGRGRGTPHEGRASRAARRRRWCHANDQPSQWYHL